MGKRVKRKEQKAKAKREAGKPKLTRYQQRMLTRGFGKLIPLKTPMAR